MKILLTINQLVEELLYPLEKEMNGRWSCTGGTRLAQKELKYKWLFGAHKSGQVHAWVSLAIRTNIAAVPSSWPFLLDPFRVLPTHLPVWCCAKLVQMPSVMGHGVAFSRCKDFWRGHHWNEAADLGLLGVSERLYFTHAQGWFYVPPKWFMSDCFGDKPVFL